MATEQPISRYLNAWEQYGGWRPVAPEGPLQRSCRRRGGGGQQQVLRMLRPKGERAPFCCRLPAVLRAALLAGQGGQLREVARVGVPGGPPPRRPAAGAGLDVRPGQQLPVCSRSHNILKLHRTSMQHSWVLRAPHRTQ